MEAGGRYDASAIAATEIGGALASVGATGTEVAGRIHPDLIDLLRWAMAKERAVRIPDAVTFAARARALETKRLRETFAQAPGAAVYVCGPARLLDAAGGAVRRRRGHHHDLRLGLRLRARILHVRREA